MNGAARAVAALAAAKREKRASRLPFRSCPLRSPHLHRRRTGGHQPRDDAAGPETLTFDELVVLIRRATGAHALIVHVPPPIMRLAARALGLLVRDVVLTPDEIDGLMAGLLVSNDPPLGEVRISEWLDQSKTSVGRTYANELQRHFVCQHDNR